MRTGGLVPEAIPSPGRLARFLAACAAAGVPFKATAGLHHPLRAEHPLTYAADAPRATMHGFLNVFAAAALALARGAAADLEAVLRDESPRRFRLDDEGLALAQDGSRAAQLAAVPRPASPSRSAPARSPSRSPTCAPLGVIP